MLSFRGVGRMSTASAFAIPDVRKAAAGSLDEVGFVLVLLSALLMLLSSPFWLKAGELSATWWCLVAALSTAAVAFVGVDAAPPDSALELSPAAADLERMPSADAEDIVKVAKGNSPRCCFAQCPGCCGIFGPLLTLLLTYVPLLLLLLLVLLMLLVLLVLLLVVLLVLLMLLVLQVLRLLARRLHGPALRRRRGGRPGDARGDV